MPETTTQKRSIRSMQSNQDQMARLGLRIPNALPKVGIHVESRISVEHQTLAKRHVLRGRESGGANNELGAYCGFVASDGHALSWTQTIDTLGVNGDHAIVIAPALVRIEVLRIVHTYELLITRHLLGSTDETGGKPKLASEVLFHGKLGQLSLDLWSRDKQFRGSVSPVFLTRSGEPITLPEVFEEGVKRAVAGACCVGCRRHTHVLVAPGRHHAAADTSPDSKGSPTPAV